ncbi:MAG: DUF5110 domain-containing protein [Planctomycetes bacterium]|nr:DUF5110 domain-containing protein [Planctomycetota bacterium]
MRRALSFALLVASLGCAVAPRQEKAVVEAGKARFTVITPECIRIEYSESGTFIDAKSLFAVNRDAGFLNYEVLRDGGVTIIDTGRIRLVYTEDGRPLGPHNLKALIRHGDAFVQWVPGQKNKENLGGTIRTLDGVHGPVSLGEGLLSRDGWYVLDDSTRHLLTEDWVRVRPEGAGTDWYLFGYGADYKAALRALTAIGGSVPMPRKYALGAWYSRYWPYSSDDYRAIVKEYCEHDFPLDVMVMDMDWHKDGWTGWSWNRNLLPDAERLLQWFHEQGLAVTLNVHPADGVGPHEDMYPVFMKDLGKDPSSKETTRFDAGDKKYLDTLFKHTHMPLENAGVDFWWLDWQQHPFTDSVAELPNLTWLNRYYFRHTGRDGKRGMLFSRWGGWGDHRHAIHFSGDASTTWKMLAFEVPFTATAGNVGCFFWSHDIGGHVGPRIEEAYVRWVQFGAMTAALRSHSTRSAELDRRPWAYGREAEDAMRIAFHLRSALFPYIYSSAWQSHRESMPLTRPMYLEHPTDPRAYTHAQQFMLGDAFLVAPITSPGAGPGKVAMQSAWFPRGVWYNWFTGERVEGDVETVVTADLNEFPLFVKGGVPIPLQPYTPRMATTPLKHLVVRCYPGKEGATTLVEDDGITSEYLHGRYARTSLKYDRRGNSVTVTVEPTRGAYTGMPDSRSTVIELADTRRATSARVDGALVPVEYDEANAINRIVVPARAVTEGVKVEVTVEDADFAALRERAIGRRLKGAQADDPAAKAMSWAVKGVAALLKNEHVYLLQGPEVLNVYSPEPMEFEVAIEDRVGPESKTVMVHRGRTSPTARIELPEPPKAQPASIGHPLRRMARLSFTMGQPATVEYELVRVDSLLKEWHVVAPFPYNRDVSISEQSYGPELAAVDLAAQFEVGGERPIVWRPAVCGEDGSVDLLKAYDAEHRLAYGVTYVYSEEEQPAAFKVWSDDAVEVWLNGEKIHSHNVFRPIEAGFDVAAGTLKKGNNELLIKVGNSILAWGFRVALEVERPVKESARPF